MLINETYLNTAELKKKISGRTYLVMKKFTIDPKFRRKYITEKKRSSRK